MIVTVCLATCGGNKSPTSPSSPSSDPCAPQLNPAPGPVSDPNGPLYHHVFMATTVDGLTLSGVHEILSAASTPDGTLLPDGTIGFYYGNGATGTYDLARLSGEAATPVGPISVNGIRPPFIVDADAQLVNGRVRLFYLNVPPSRTNTGTVCVAESSDGLNFQTLGLAMVFGQGRTDPSVTQLAGGSWLMGISFGQQTQLAQSSNGVSFTPSGVTVSYGGVPEVTTLSSGRVRMYVCANGNIDAYVSADASASSWTREGTVVQAGPSLGYGSVCDPSVVRGTNVFLFKAAPH